MRWIVGEVAGKGIVRAIDIYVYQSTLITRFRIDEPDPSGVSFGHPNLLLARKSDAHKSAPPLILILVRRTLFRGASGQEIVHEPHTFPIELEYRYREALRTDVGSRDLAGRAY